MVEHTHVPVLSPQVLAGLDLRPAGLYIDGTVGAGGHAAGILGAAPQSQLLGLDRDSSALALSRQRLECFGNRATLVHSNFAEMEAVAEQLRFGPVDGVLLDLGMSSMQLADAERGFSLRLDGPLDMRMDAESPGTGPTAADIVNGYPVDDLADLIHRYGEEPGSRAIAAAIVRARPISTTSQLADVVASAIRRRGRASEQRLHPATRVFQAIRMVVNQELESLEQGLAGALSVLKPTGRLVVISFHSIEDRAVKQFFAKESRNCICPAETMVCVCGHQAQLARVNRKPIRPTSQEIERNPRSRSARLRIATKL